MLIYLQICFINFSKIYLEITVSLTPPTFSFTTLVWGCQLGMGGLKIYDPLTHGSIGPTFEPVMQEFEDPHHPQLDWWIQSVGLALMLHLTSILLSLRPPS